MMKGSQTQEDKGSEDNEHCMGRNAQSHKFTELRAGSLVFEGARHMKLRLRWAKSPGMTQIITIKTVEISIFNDLISYRLLWSLCGVAGRAGVALVWP